MNMLGNGGADAAITRRGALALAAMAPALLSACSSSPSSSWAFERDDDLKPQGGSPVPTEGWAPLDDGIQLQIVGSGNPAPEIEDAVQDGSKLTVRMRDQFGPATMDARMYVFRLIPPSDAGDVDGVSIVRNGDKQTLERLD